MPDVTHSNLMPFRLAEHQLQLTQTYFDSKCRQDLVLRTRVGAGASTAVIHLVVQVVKAAGKDRARVLLVVSTVLIGQYFRELFARAGHRATMLDRKSLRAVQADDEPSLIEIQPREEIFLVARNSLMRTDFADALGAMAWNLLVIDEINAIREPLVNGLCVLMKSAKRRIFIDRGGLGTNPLPLDSEPTVLDWNDRDIFANQKPTIHVGSVEYDETREELELKTSVKRLFDSLPPTIGDGPDWDTADWDTATWTGSSRTAPISPNPLRKALMRSLKSSPAAVEQLVMRLMGQIEKGDALRLNEYDAQDDPVQTVQIDAFHDDIAKQVLDRCGDVMKCIDAIPLDSKLEAFLIRLRQIASDSSNGAAIFVITDSQSTSYYLAAEAEEIGMPTRVIGEGMTGGDVLAKIASFRVDGGLLIASAAALKGLELDSVDHLVFYDLSTDNHHSLSLVLQRFFKFRRRREITVHVLISSDHKGGAQPFHQLFDRAIADVWSVRQKR